MAAIVVMSFVHDATHITLSSFISVAPSSIDTRPKGFVQEDSPLLVPITAPAMIRLEPWVATWNFSSISCIVMEIDDYEDKKGDKSNAQNLTGKLEENFEFRGDCGSIINVGFAVIL
jgi:hypothetical protein